MRIKPRTRYQWSQLACEITRVIERDANHTDLKELAHAILVILEYPAEMRTKAWFERMDRLLDKCNGVEYETIGAEHIRKFDEAHRG